MSYWMHETSGKMKEIVLKFTSNDVLSSDELKTLRWYIHQYADAMPYKPDNLLEIFQMTQAELKQYNFETLVCDFGIDAL